MKLASCPRLFEVEAMRDGRLAGAERTSFERHMTSCPTCSREAQALEVLAEKFRTDPEKRNVDELRVRRERIRLLAASDDSLLAEKPPRAFGSRRLVRLFAVAAVVAAFFVFGRLRPTVQPASASNTVIRADSGARGRSVWRIIARKSFSSAACSGSMSHTRRAQASLLSCSWTASSRTLGTTFTVSVEEGRTVSRLGRRG